MNRCNWDWLSDARWAGAEPFVPHEPPGTIPMQIGQKRFGFDGLGYRAGAVRHPDNNRGKVAKPCAAERACNSKRRPALGYVEDTPELWETFRSRTIPARLGSPDGRWNPRHGRRFSRNEGVRYQVVPGCGRRSTASLQNSTRSRIHRGKAARRKGIRK